MSYENSRGSHLHGGGGGGGSGGGGSSLVGRLMNKSLGKNRDSNQTSSSQVLKQALKAEKEANQSAVAELLRSLNLNMYIKPIVLDLGFDDYEVIRTKRVSCII